jgi:hypothetical protein
MNTAVLITLIICGTILIATLIGILFTMWVINKGAEFAREKKN